MNRDAMYVDLNVARNLQLRGRNLLEPNSKINSQFLPDITGSTMSDEHVLSLIEKYLNENVKKTLDNDLAKLKTEIKNLGNVYANKTSVNDVNKNLTNIINQKQKEINDLKKSVQELKTELNKIKENNFKPV
jgi:virulence-associated protein VapD